MILSINNISKAYGSNRALSELTLTLTPGIYALLGPNGSGKSTLMNIITDNLKADSGEILYSEDGREHENVLKMGARFRELIGFMPQYSGMYPNFTVEQFLWYMAVLKDVGAHLKGREKKRYIADEIEQILSAVELSDASGQRIGALSGGMKQRLALAQAVLGSPKILILDEPTAGLDPRQRISVRNYISRLALNKIVIIATHVVSDIESIADEVILLKKGVVVEHAPPSVLIEQMEGKVWSVPAAESDIPRLQKAYQVTNIGRDEQNGGIFLRILSDVTPTDAARPVCPGLEDSYLYVFGEPRTV